MEILRSNERISQVRCATNSWGMMEEMLEEEEMRAKERLLKKEQVEAPQVLSETFLFYSMDFHSTY